MFEGACFMARLDVEFCGLNFKNPIVVASLEPTNSPDLTKQCFDARVAIIRTLTDIENLACLTGNSKYCTMNQEGEFIEGKVPRDFVFYSRTGYSITY
jgi:dihydroorotate dehydrogenase (fumarate)/dihydropyrimidine dehydrogenase (NAD+) subunit PreA